MLQDSQCPYLRNVLAELIVGNFYYSQDCSPGTMCSSSISSWTSGYYFSQRFYVTLCSSVLRGWSSGNMKIFFPWSCTEFLPVSDKIRIWGVQVACWPVYFSGGLFLYLQKWVLCELPIHVFLVSTFRTQSERPVEVLRTLKTKPWKKLQQQLDTAVMHFPGLWSLQGRTFKVCSKMQQMLYWTP